VPIISQFRQLIGRRAWALTVVSLLAGPLAAQTAPAPQAGQAAPSATAAAGPDIHDIHSLVPLTFWEKHGPQVIADCILAVLVLIWIIWLLMRKKPTPPLTPYERALKELAYARGLQNTGQDKIFAVAASDAVRHYLENAYRIPAPERTTDEFLLEASRHTWLKGELTVLLKRFLEYCDLAKFAGQQFGPEERALLMKAAGDFVDAAEKSRRPPPTPASANKPAAAPPPAGPPATPTLSTQ